MDYLTDTIVLLHKARSPFLAIERGHLRVSDHCFLLTREDGDIEIPVGMISCLLIEPGVTITHEAVKLAAECDTLLVWTGEAGVRFYSSGMPGGKNASRIVDQVRIHLDPVERMNAAKRLYRLMFGEDLSESPSSIEELRGIEGARVKKWYRKIAEDYGVGEWQGRSGSPGELQSALGYATSCLYGLSEAVILSAGYSPAIGTVHSGDQRSMVFDLADTVKFRTVVPLAFETYRESDVDIGNRVRRRCRDLFREMKMAERLFANLYEIMGTYVDHSSCP